MRKNRSWIWVIIGGVLLFCAYLGYKEQTDRPITDLLIDKQTRIATDELASFNHLIFGVNTFSLRVDSVMAGYDAWIHDWKTGPSGAEGLVEGIEEIAGFYEWQVDFERQHLPLTLQYQAFEFEQAAGELQSLISDLHTYYENKRYRDDNWSRGQIMHDPLRKAHQAFVNARNSLYNALEPQWQERYRAALADLQYDGHVYRSLILRLTYRARMGRIEDTDSLFVLVPQLQALKEKESLRISLISELDNWEESLTAFQLAMASYCNQRNGNERYTLSPEMEAIAEKYPHLLSANLTYAKEQYLQLEAAYRALGFGKNHLYMLHPTGFLSQ